MTVNIGFVMDPIASINPKKDSTLAMIRAASVKGWNIFYMEQKDLYINNGIANGLLQELTLSENTKRWYQLGTKISTPLALSFHTL